MAALDAKKDFDFDVYLYVTDFECKHSDITRTLGITPSSCWQKGERILQQAQRAYKENGWSLASSLNSKGLPIERHLLELKRVLGPISTAFKDLPTNTEITLMCVVQAYKYIPRLGLEPEDVSFLSSIGAGFEIDLYDLREVE